ncbi:MAG: hypothetical protein ACKOJH_08030, partial [Actinomycetota bacterium]
MDSPCVAESLCVTASFCTSASSAAVVVLAAGAANRESNGFQRFSIVENSNRVNCRPSVARSGRGVNASRGTST